MFSLENNVALITGATGGIGEHIARVFHQNGAKVILSGRNEEKLKKLVEELGENSQYLICDLASNEQVSTLIDDAHKIHGKLDVLICNAGVTKDGLLLRMKDEDFDSVIDTNLKSTFILNRNAFKKMMKARYGRIINIASVVGVTGNAGQANYVASKAGMIGMSKSVAQESASRGITVNSIAPGFIQTAMTDELNDKQKESILKNIPLGRMGLPEEIAASALFLASKEASYITGQTLHVNGGMLMV